MFKGKNCQKFLRKVTTKFFKDHEFYPPLLNKVISKRIPVLFTSVGLRNRRFCVGMCLPLISLFTIFLRFSVPDSIIYIYIIFNNMRNFIKGFILFSSSLYSINIT